MGGPRSPRRPERFDLGRSGLFVTDLDRDGKSGLLLTAGDNLEIYYPAPQPWHGCVWLRNRGDGTFEPGQIAAWDIGGHRPDSPPSRCFVRSGHCRSRPSPRHGQAADALKFLGG